MEDAFGTGAGLLIGILILAVFGAIVGWLAGLIVKGSGYGLFADIIIGIVGANIAGAVFPVIGIPVAVVSFVLILVAFAPLLLLLTEETALMVIAIIFTVLAFLFVIFILIIIGAVITPILELAWRRAVLDNRGVFASIGETFGLIKGNLKDVFVIWLLMLGIGFAWIFVALIIILPVSLLVAAILGGIPALLVYLISESVLGAAIAGGPPALLAIIVISSFGTGLYLVFRSSVWTLAYLEIQGLETARQQTPLDNDKPDVDTSPLDPQPEV